MNYKRADRVASQIMSELGIMLLQELRDPDFGFMTITKVKVTDDLRHAKIYYSVLGDESVQKTAHAALQKAKGFIRSEIGHRMQLRYVPELAFYYDDTVAYADHINQIINKIHKQDESAKPDQES